MADRRRFHRRRPCAMLALIALVSLAGCTATLEDADALREERNAWVAAEMATPPGGAGAAGGLLLRADDTASVTIAYGDAPTVVGSARLSCTGPEMMTIGMTYYRESSTTAVDTEVACDGAAVVLHVLEGLPPATRVDVTASSPDGPGAWAAVLSPRD